MHAHTHRTCMSTHVMHACDVHAVLYEAMYVGRQVPGLHMRMCSVLMQPLTQAKVLSSPRPPYPTPPAYVPPTRPLPTFPNPSFPRPPYPLTHPVREDSHFQAQRLVEYHVAYDAVQSHVNTDVDCRQQHLLKTQAGKASQNVNEVQRTK